MKGVRSEWSLVALFLQPAENLRSFSILGFWPGQAKQTQEGGGSQNPEVIGNYPSCIRYTSTYLYIENIHMYTYIYSYIYVYTYNQHTHRHTVSLSLFLSLSVSLSFLSVCLSLSLSPFLSLV